MSKRKAVLPISVRAPAWEVVDGGIGLRIDMGGKVPPFYVRIRSAEGFKAFTEAMFEAARDAWPQIAQDWDDVNTPIPPEETEPA